MGKHMIKTMTLDQALAVAKQVAHTRLKWGKQGIAPYTVHQLCDCIALLQTAGAEVEAAHQDELTLLRRQLAAANARVAGLSKKNVANVG
jgi:hypothetical protein